MQNIITLGQINDALKFTTVTAAQLAEMGFAALANKPICEALPQEEARRLRTAKLYPAESIGQIRVALAKRLAAPASCLHQIQEPAPVQAAQPIAWPKNAQDVRDFFRSDFITAQFAAEDQKPCDEDRYLISAHDFVSAVNWWADFPHIPRTHQAAPAAVAVPEDWMEYLGFELDAEADGIWQVIEDTGARREATLTERVLWKELTAIRAALAATPEAAAPVVLPEPVMFAIDRFDAYFRSANGVPPNARISVPTSEWQALRALLAAGGQAQAVQHPDDVAVDVLAGLMKAKLAKQRSKGYGGWDTDCTRERLSELLRGHVDKGDPVDVANFCAFLLARGEGIAPQAQARSKSGWTFEELEAQLAEAIKADPENCRAVGEELLKSIHDNFNALKAAGWDGPVDSPVEVVTDLLNLLDEAKAASPQAQADARDAEQERWMEIGKAIERACIDQPDSTEIVISLERDAGTVTMFDPDGNEHDQFSHEDGFAGVVNAAIEAAIAAAKGE